MLASWKETYLAVLNGLTSRQRCSIENIVDLAIQLTDESYDKVFHHRNKDHEPGSEIVNCPICKDLHEKSASKG